MGFLKKIFGKPKAANEILKNRINLHIISDKSYQSELCDMAKSVAENFDKILYLSLNKPVEKIVEILKENGIDTEKFVFVDAVHNRIGKNIAYHNLIFINSPKEFQKFNSKLLRAIDDEKAGCLIFDSLSTMLIYQDESTVTRFAHDLISRLVMNKYNGEITCLSEDVNSSVVKDIAMFVDKVIGADENSGAKQDKSNIRQQIEKLEKELMSVKQVYTLKYISEGSYLKTKERLENKLKKLRSRRIQ